LAFGVSLRVMIFAVAGPTPYSETVPVQYAEDPIFVVKSASGVEKVGSSEAKKMA
jgi:hypothetical protein